MSKGSGVVVRNIYYMMAYAFKALDLDEYTKLTTEEFDNVEDLMAAILTIGIDLQRKRGLERNYSVVHEDIPAIRGRVDARGTARLRSAGSAFVSCEWDELSEDTYKNRVLKAVGKLLVSSELVAEECRRNLRRSLLVLRDVREIDPSRIAWGRLRYHRNNASYRFLMNVCRLVVTSMLLTEDDGEVHLGAFEDSQQLYSLYERFVLEWFHRHHPELRPAARVVPRSVDGEAPSFLPQLVTDVTLHGPHSTLIIECKCYGKILHTHHGKEIADPKHVNQIFSYVLHEARASGVPVSGMLLYALTDSDVSRSDQWFDLGHSFRLWTLDLGQSFEAISARLEDIARLV